MYLLRTIVSGSIMQVRPTATVSSEAADESLLNEKAVQPPNEENELSESSGVQESGIASVRIRKKSTQGTEVTTLTSSSNDT